MRGDNGKPFIDTLYNIRFAPDLCNWLFSIIVIINLVHTFLFCKVFCTVSFSVNEQNTVTLPHIVHKKQAFLVKRKENSRSQKEFPKIICLWIIASNIMTQVHKVTTG